ncbi:MAG TPA: hypothetical protein VHW09_00090 [Bryobacteraceae bacterium]|jgi:hypothetical protein|nr:hypothetical protein [Bryobacteraceae bacterium]
MYNYLLPALCVLGAMTSIPAIAQPATPKVTDVLVTLTVKPGIARDQIMKVMKEEVSATVRLYLDGKIRQWYSRADGRGVVFVLACGSVDEAKATMEGLPLAKLNLMDYAYLPLAPLQPLATLLPAAAEHQ